MLKLVQSVNNIVNNYESDSFKLATKLESSLTAKFNEAIQRLGDITEQHSKAKKDLKEQLGIIYKKIIVLKPKCIRPGIFRSIEKCINVRF